MDWSKAKTILIFAFLITNIFLGMVIFNGRKQVDPTLTDDFINKTIDILAKKNIKLEGDIPKIDPTLTGLTVEFEDLDINSINNNFFKGLGSFKVESDGSTIIENEEEAINISSNKIISYENYREENKYRNLDSEKVLTISNDFLRDRKFYRDNMRLLFSKKMGDYYLVSYVGTYEGVDLEHTYVNLEIDNRGVRRLDRLWLNVLNEGNIDIYISTAPKAILNLIGNEDYYNKTITDISLVYYFEPEKNKYIETPSKARRGRTTPGWRILFDDGTKVIIDNYQ